MGRLVNNPPLHAARYRASQAAKKGAGGGAGRDRDWRARNDNLGGWRDSAQALPKCPPTPPIELWDCDIEEAAAAAAATTTPTSTPTKEDDDEEDKENWDTAPDELSWEHMTPPTDNSGIPSPEEEQQGLDAAEASLPIKEDDEGIWFRCSSPCWRVREEWKQASYAQRVDMEKYYLVHGPDISFREGHTHSRAPSQVW